MRRGGTSTTGLCATPGYPELQGGQDAGRHGEVPSGSLLRIRINQGLSTQHAQPGAILMVRC